MDFPQLCGDRPNLGVECVSQPLYFVYLYAPVSKNDQEVLGVGIKKPWVFPVDHIVKQSVRLLSLSILPKLDFVKLKWI